MVKEELLLGYFSNTLNDLEKTEFEQLLETDIEFREQFEFEKAVKVAVKKTRNEELKSKLQGFEEELKETPVKTIKSKVRKKVSVSWLKIAASLLLFIAAGWLAYTSFFSKNYDSLYADNFKVYPNTEVALIRGDNSIDETIRKAFVAYETEDYKEAIKQFELIENKEHSILFYEAQSYLQLQDYKKAKELLNSVILKNTSFIAESYWYLALINIKEKEKESAQYYLKKNIVLNTFKVEQAKTMLETLSSFPPQE